MSSSSDTSYAFQPNRKERYTQEGEEEDNTTSSTLKGSPHPHQPTFDLKHFRGSDYVQQTTYNRLPTGNESPSPTPWCAGTILSHSLSGHAIITFACMRLTTATLQLSLLVYLQLAYLALPRSNTGQLPRMEGLYATIPFISCIGSLHLSTYQAFTAMIVLLSLTTDSIIFYRAFNNPVAYWFRRINILASLAAYALTLWLSFAAKNASTHLHLTIIALHNLAILIVKTSSLATDHRLRETYPALRYDPIALLIRYWKEATVVFALPMAILLNMGVYTCRSNMNDNIMTPETTCYRVLAIAAPADWLYALLTANWSLQMGYEVFNGPHINRIVTGSKASAVIYGSSEER
jgi:hypothetical protein